MESFNFVGHIIAVCEVRSGVTKSTGNKWASQEYVIEESGAVQYPKRMCFNVFGEDKIKAMGIKVGEELRVSFDVNAREYNGKWYNDIRAWKVERMVSQDASVGGQPVAQPSVAVGVGAVGGMAQPSTAASVSGGEPKSAGGVANTPALEALKGAFDCEEGNGELPF